MPEVLSPKEKLPLTSPEASFHRSHALHDNDGQHHHKGKSQVLFKLSWWRVRLLRLMRCKASCVIGLVAAIAVISFGVHRVIAHSLTTKSWAEAPINFVDRECPAPDYPTLAQSQTTTTQLTPPKICLTTLTDEQQADWTQSLLKWRDFGGLMEWTWPNKKQYCEKHGYQLFDSSPYLDNSRPPSWSKIVAARRLLKEEGCDWVLWLDADTVVMNSSKKVESFLPAPDASQDFVVTKQKTDSYNAGAWAIRNTPWSLEFLDSWWNRNEFVRAKGLSVSGDNDALYNFLKEMTAAGDFDKHIVVPPRCQFNSVTKWVTPEEAKQFESEPDLAKKEPWYGHTEYYHRGDFIAHVAGRNNKIDTSIALLQHAT